MQDMECKKQYVNGQVYQYRRGVKKKLLHAIRNRYTKSKMTLERLK